VPRKPSLSATRSPTLTLAAIWCAANGLIDLMIKFECELNIPLEWQSCESVAGLCEPLSRRVGRREWQTRLERLIATAGAEAESLMAEETLFRITTTPVDRIPSSLHAVAWVMLSESPCIEPARVWQSVLDQLVHLAVVHGAPELVSSWRLPDGSTGGSTPPRPTSEQLWGRCKAYLGRSFSPGVSEAFVFRHAANAVWAVLPLALPHAKLKTLYCELQSHKTSDEAKDWDVGPGRLVRVDRELAVYQRDLLKGGTEAAGWRAFLLHFLPAVPSASTQLRAVDPELSPFGPWASSARALRVNLTPGKCFERGSEYGAMTLTRALAVALNKHWEVASPMLWVFLGMCQWAIAADSITRNASADWCVLLGTYLYTAVESRTARQFLIEALWDVNRRLALAVLERVLLVAGLPWGAISSPFYSCRLAEALSRWELLTFTDRGDYSWSASSSSQAAPADSASTRDASLQHLPELLSSIVPLFVRSSHMPLTCSMPPPHLVEAVEGGRMGKLRPHEILDAEALILTRGVLGGEIVLGALTDVIDLYSSFVEERMVGQETSDIKDSSEEAQMVQWVVSAVERVSWLQQLVKGELAPRTPSTTPASSSSDACVAMTEVVERFVHSAGLGRVASDAIAAASRFDKLWNLPATHWIVPSSSSAVDAKERGSSSSSEASVSFAIPNSPPLSVGSDSPRESVTWTID
jgi:hypothetical protein